MSSGYIESICALAHAESFTRTALEAIPDECITNLIEAELLVKEGCAEEVVCLQCEEPHLMALEWDSRTQGYRGFCAEAGFVDVADEDVALFAVDRAWFSISLRRSLALSGASEDRLITGYAWYLGTAVTNRIDWNVIVLAGLGPVDTVEPLTMRARALPAASTSVVLTTASEIDGQLLAPYNIWFVRLQDVANLEVGPSVRLSLDKERMAAQLRGFVNGSVAPKRGKGGAAGKDPQLVDRIIADRRKRGIAFASKSAESREVVCEFKKRYPDRDSPAENTVRNKLMKLDLPGSA